MSIYAFDIDITGVLHGQDPYYYGGTRDGW